MSACQLLNVLPVQENALLNSRLGWLPCCCVTGRGDTVHLRVQEAGTIFTASQVAIYNYMKLQVLRAKASLSTGKDVEKLGGERQALLGNKVLLSKDTIEVAADSGTHGLKEDPHTFGRIR